MQTSSIPRRQFFRLLGAGALLGTVGTASASEGRYIVGTRSRGARREAQRRARSVHHVLDFGAYGSAVAGTFPEEALRGLSRRPDVDYIEEDGRMYAISIDATTVELANSWGVDRIDAEKTGTSTGTGAKIAVLDTGVDYTHPDLLGNYVGGVTYVDGTADEMDDNGHGTHCAGIAAATGGDGGVVGVAPDAGLYGVKVLDGGGSGYYSDIAAGLDWCVANAMHVASMSLGGGRGSTTLERACNNARDNHVFVVAAAGNDGRGRLSYPAKYDSVVAVSASDTQDRIASWSNTGDGLDHAAPGVGITSTVPTFVSGDGYATWSGTSMACPHVAGVAGLVMAGGMTGGDARTLLAATAEDVNNDGYDKSYGYGLIDAEAAVAGSSGGGGGDGGTTEDTTAPSAPGDLAATVTGETTVDLSWSEPTDASGIDHYDVYVDGGLDRTVAAPATGTTVDGLSSGTTYTFGVSATDGAGNESTTSTVQATTDAASGGADTTAPAGSITGVTDRNSNSPHRDYGVAWEASDDVGLAEVTVQLRETGATDLVDSVPTAVGGTTVTGTTEVSGKFGDRNGTAYEVRLVVTDAAGNGVTTPWASA